MNKVIIDGQNLKIEDVVNVARNGYIVELSGEAKERIEKARALVDRFVEEGRVEYGITTGFGKFSDVVISKDDAKKLQRNLIVSHACGVGEEFDTEIVRAIMLLRANALSKGYSGVRISTVKTLIDMLNKGVHPVIYEKGSLGASGDLAPLSHMVLVMIGEGEAYYNGERLSGKEAMEKAGIDIIELVEKEGLALINGTQVMTAVGALTIYDAVNISKTADIVASMTVESLKGITDAYYHRVHEVRPQKGQIKCAKNLLTLLDGSSLTTKQGEIRVQDAYTLRCIPQIHGASKDAIEYVKRVVETEINSATDNPLIFEDEDRVISGGNFHGQPMALAMDFLGIALSELANVSERRIERLVNYQLNDLPPFLTKKGGLNSGFMIAQYSAAALVSENKVLAHPASVDSIPSSANQEDHVSMGTIAARKARNILYNVSRVLGIEYLASSQALHFRGDVKLGKGTQRAYNLIRKHIEPLNEDRVMYVDINKASSLITSGELVRTVENEVGEIL
ncbi:histidine ammonia-lyase [Caloramator quimbayensis]|uniref:Histidine ammonia-lyase n=1 Tax=Caloramator quimbayensis TaxID=1147123 RepID=A0A1T4WQY8_9CLOT|nr:histidine ammonia-lyase [Caloramator quimbayensis]SKA79763.1 histidine ammonia-lyase [Caloramator quimbayensis]